MPQHSRDNNDANSLSTSHASEIARELSPTPSRIPKAKWQEILDDEHISHIIGSTREEIIRSAADTIYEGYLRKAVYGFVTNCAYEAWMRAFQWVHLKYDNQKISSTSDVCTPKETPPSITKDLRLSRRKVPTVYGRLEKLTLARKSSSRCEASCAKGTLRGRDARLNTKARVNP